MKPILDMFKAAEKELTISKNYDQLILQNFEKDLSEFIQKTDLSRKQNPFQEIEKGTEQDIEPVID
ncbi:MAG: hypothetical protein MTP17_03690 [Candidatus Midichloria sp.]|nr:MAG: hypothetical protein MTP17_03690 [Candidatus Midichloria sp.]